LQKGFIANKKLWHVNTFQDLVGLFFRFRYSFTDS